MLYRKMIELKSVWKKYSTNDVLRRSLREDLSQLFTGKWDEHLSEDEFWALSDLSFVVNEGECLGLYGPNGSGKSTILKLIASVTYPTMGEVKAGGRVAPLISVGAGFHHDLTGRENIYVNGTIIGMTIKELDSKIKDIIEFSEIERKFLNMPIRKYSSGMCIRLGFSIAIHSSAEILLMDEVLAVGDEGFRIKSLNKVEELKKHKTMIFVTHNREMMEKIADRIIYLDHGKIVKEAVT